MRIAAWNVTMLINNYRVDIFTENSDTSNWTSETHIPGLGKMKLGDIEFIYSDRKGGVNTQIGSRANKEAAKSYLCSEGINIGILIAPFRTKKFRVSVIVVYALVEPTDGDGRGSDEFYLQLQKQKTKFDFLFGNSYAQASRNRD